MLLCTLESVYKESFTGNCHFKGTRPEEVVHTSLLEILQHHVIAFLQSGQYWNKVAPTPFHEV